MIVRCVDCGTPTVRDVCPQCLGNAAWHASVILVLAMLVTAAAFHACGGNAAGQDAPSRGGLSVRDRDDTARCLLAEADGHEDEMYAVLGVIERRAVAHRMTWGGIVRRYCAVFHPTSPQLAARVVARRAAILALPAARNAWSEYWPTALRAIAAWRNGEVIDPCPLPAMEWGDRLGDSERARRAGWREVSCGSRLNSFWIPGRRSVRAELARGARP